MTVALLASIAVQRSKNPKLSRTVGAVATTWAAQKTCSPLCPLRFNGCYYEKGPAAFTGRRLNRAARSLQPYEIARQEAHAIRALPGDKPLRLHSGGDCRTAGAARLLADAVKAYIGKRVNYRREHGLPTPACWTYTHSWRTIPRSAWGPISVLASCDNADEVAWAHRRGYATALVTEAHPGKKRYTLPTVPRPIAVLPCVEQTMGVKCDECKLCWNDKRLLAARITVGFARH